MLADQPLLSRSFNRLDVDRLPPRPRRPLREEIARSAKRARHRTSDRALPRFTQRATRAAADRRGAAADHPRLRRDAELLAEALDEYLHTLAPHWRRVLGGYTLVDIAHKVVGVGSVGLRAYVALLEGSIPDDVVFLQLKQARRSVLASTCTASRPGTPTRASGWSSTSRRCRRSATRCSGWTTVGRAAVLRAAVPQHEGHRRRSTRSTPRRWPTTPASSGTCWPRATRAPAAPR